MANIPVLKRKNYSVRVYTAGICYYENRYLLLRISKFYPLCPGDWEWLTCSKRIRELKDRRGLLQNVLFDLKFHTGLNGSAISIYQPLKWFDHEYKLTYVLHPILIELEKPSVTLTKKKFSEYKLVEQHNILNYDRSSYLSSYISHLNLEV